MILLLFVFWFIYDRWSYTEPLKFDIISPLFTLILAITSLSINTDYSSYIFAFSLLMDSMADFIMSPEYLSHAIFLFSIGHIMKQLAFLFTNFLFNNVLIFITSILSAFFMFIVGLVTNEISIPIIVLYTLIISFSLIHTSILIGDISWGYLLFGISDLIIAFELVITKIYPRQLRVLSVPLLYWIGEYIISYHLFQLIETSK